VIAFATLTGPDLRELAAAADLRDKRRANNLAGLYGIPTLGAFSPGASPLPPTSPEELGSAMAALALRTWSVGGLLRSAEGYAAGRLPAETVDRVVIDVHQVL